MVDTFGNIGFGELETRVELILSASEGQQKIGRDK